MRGDGTGPLDDHKITYSEYDEESHDPQADARALWAILRNLPQGTLVALIEMQYGTFTDMVRHGPAGFPSGEPMC